MNALSLSLVTHNADISARWHRWLAAQGWSVEDVPESQILRKHSRVRKGPVLLDATLIKEADMAAVRELSAAHVPVIVFGDGQNASNESVVRWLQEGADDFIPSHIHERLLVAKLQAFARRIRPASERTILMSRRREVKADVKRGLAWIRDRGGHWRACGGLTATEHRILCLFLSLPGSVLERDFMMDRVWGDKAASVFPATLTQHLMSLRRKLGPRGEVIRTVYGRGYMFLEEP